MSDSPDSLTPPPAIALLQQAQTLEGEGKLAAALTTYDEAIALIRPITSPDVETRRILGIVWMNRGNALQRLAAELGQQERNKEAVDAVRAAVGSYDEAVALFKTLPLEASHDYRNHLGAAYLNRGHAFTTVSAFEPAAESFTAAIAELEQIPRGDDPSFKLNLAGALTNLAHTRFSQHEQGKADSATVLAQAAEAARKAIAEIAEVELAHVAFAEMSLRARRNLAVTLGAQLVHAEAMGHPTADLAAETSDVIDEGLQLARECEKRGASHLRVFATRLFRMGVQLYGTNQPQFIAEFILENVDPTNPEAAFSNEPEMRAVADQALAQVLAHLQRPGVLVAGVTGSRDPEKLAGIARSIREAQQKLAASPVVTPTTSA